MTLKFKTMKMNWLARIPLELIFWITALILLGTAKPTNHHLVDHFTFCPLSNMGLSWCPGCGLGRSVTQLLHGNLNESLHFHWLGIPAVLVICYRIVTLGLYEKERIKIKFKRRKDYV